jgi:hypothetical protein
LAKLVPWRLGSDFTSKCTEDHSAGVAVVRSLNLLSSGDARVSGFRPNPPSLFQPSAYGVLGMALTFFFPVLIRFRSQSGRIPIPKISLSKSTLGRQTWWVLSNELSFTIFT